MHILERHDFDILTGHADFSRLSVSVSHYLGGGSAHLLIPTTARTLFRKMEPHRIKLDDSLGSRNQRLHQRNNFPIEMTVCNLDQANF
jgi:hypothetical protein